MFQRSIHSTAFLTVILLVLGLIGAPKADIPKIVSYQGKVTDTGGTPIADGDYSMTFTIYDAETSGTSLWSSGAVNVTVSGGVFNVLLGDTGQPTLNLDFDIDYWLEIDIAGDVQSPRQRLGSVGYAYMSSGVVAGTEVVGTLSTPVMKGTNYGTGAGLRGDSDQGTGVRGESAATDGKGVYGVANAATGYNYGVYGETGSTWGRGVYGVAMATTSSNWGVHGTNYSTSGGGVYGGALATTGSPFGVYGLTQAPNGKGVEGFAIASTGAGYGVYGKTSSPDGFGVYGHGDASTGTNYGVYGRTDSPDGFAGYFMGRIRVTDDLTVSSGGNVGIGLDEPSHPLVVAGPESDATGTGAQVLIRDSSNSDHKFALRIGDSSGSNLHLDGYTGSSWYEYITVERSSGFVGIGTPSPSANLDVSGYIIAQFKMGIRNGRAYLNNIGEIVANAPNGNENFYAGWGGLGDDVGWAYVADASGNDQAGMYVDAGGDGFVYADTKNFRIANPNQPDTEIWYACIEGPEAAAYLRGTARLENGRTYITFPDHFQAVATAEGMTVQLTPWSAESEGLAVTQRSLEGIEVRELRNGTGTYDFDYTVMAIRDGYQDYRVIRPADELQRKPAPDSKTTSG